MMRFRGQYDQFPAREHIYMSRTKNPRRHSLSAFNWPTVDELEDVIAPMTADTVLQILRGDGIYRGPDAKTGITKQNVIRNLSNDRHLVVKTKPARKRAVRTQRVKQGPTKTELKVVKLMKKYTGLTGKEAIQLIRS